jgi:hypothetical protein
MGGPKQNLAAWATWHLGFVHPWSVEISNPSNLFLTPTTVYDYLYCQTYCYYDKIILEYFPVSLLLEIMPLC